MAIRVILDFEHSLLNNKHTDTNLAVRFLSRKCTAFYSIGKQANIYYLLSQI